jgi:hypothetical protein
MKMEIKDFERYIKQIRDVESCRIILDESGDISELHIISNLRRSAKQISRDIQSVLSSKFGMDIDHKKISIAQINIGEIEAEYCRLKLDTIGYSSTLKKADIRVVLEKEGEYFEGLASGANTETNILRLSAKAALQAAEKYCGMEDIFILEDIRISGIAGQEVVICAVSVVVNSGEKLLSGTAIMEGERKRAAVKATLDAINRSVSRFNSNIQAG